MGTIRNSCLNTPVGGQSHQKVERNMSGDIWYVLFQRRFWSHFQYTERESRYYGSINSIGFTLLMLTNLE
jgi:hypothetical protein